MRSIVVRRLREELIVLGASGVHWVTTAAVASRTVSLLPTHRWVTVGPGMVVTGPPRDV